MSLKRRYGGNVPFRGILADESVTEGHIKVVKHFYQQNNYDKRIYKINYHSPRALGIMTLKEKNTFTASK